jgi:hypothetical protein
LLQKLGKFKDEVGGEEIQAFVGLRPKLYALKLATRIVKRAKGVKRSALNKKITFEHYLECLKNETVVLTSFNRIQSKKHIITSVEQRKAALTSGDNKRHIRTDGVQTYAYGHYKIV